VRVFLTGGTGLVGRAVLARLLARGLAVRALAREDEAGRAAFPSVEWVKGDLLDPRPFLGALRGAEVLLHCAGAMLPDPIACARVNRDGTRALLDGAAAAGVRRAVFVSTVAVYGDGPFRNATEEAALAGAGPYARSKIGAEEAVLRSEAFVSGVCVLRPCGILGRGDRHLAPALRALVAPPSVPLPGAGRTPIDLVDAADLADLLVLTGVEARGGPGPYNVTGGSPLSLREILEAAAEAAGSSPEWRTLSLEEARAENAQAAERGEPPPVHPSLLAAASLERTVSIDRARGELGYAPRVPPREAVRRAISALPTSDVPR